MSNANDVLMGGGLESFPFSKIGDGFRGAKIVRIGDPRQSTDFSTGAPKWWDDAKTQPIMQVMIEIELAQNERTDPNDFGARALYVTQGSERQKALASAVRAVGQRNVEVGGYLSMVFTGTEASKMRGGNDKHLFQAAYQAPPTAGSSALMATPEAQPVQQQAPVQPANPQAQVQQTLAAQNPLAVPGPVAASGVNAGQPGMAAPVVQQQSAQANQAAAPGVDLSSLPADIQQLLALRAQQGQQPQ